MNIYELSEQPVLEDVSQIEQDALQTRTSEDIDVEGKTPILKVMLSGTPYYHFRTVDVDLELVNKNSFIVLGGKTFYKGLKNIKIHSRLNLNKAS